MGDYGLEFLYNDVIYTQSIDNGENFTKPIKLNNDTQLILHSFS